MNSKSKASEGKKTVLELKRGTDYPKIEVGTVLLTPIDAYSPTIPGQTLLELGSPCWDFLNIVVFEKLSLIDAAPQ